MNETPRTGAMSDTQKAAAPHSVLVAQLLDPNEPKTEREHAAVRELTAAIAMAEAAVATVERCKQVCDATAEGWRETQAELDEALAKLARYETLRPASEHDGKTRVIAWHWTRFADGTAEWVPQWIDSVIPQHMRWTPLPDVKEAKP